MKLKISIYTRLVFWIALLVCLLFGAVLFVIRIREARILQDETKSRALLQARYIADANLQNLSHQDQPAVQKYVDEHSVGDVAYIVFYNRDGQPAAWNAPSGPTARSSPRASSRTTCRWRKALRRRSVLFSMISLSRVLEVEVFAFSQTAGRWGSVKLGLSLEPMYARLRDIQRVLLLIGIGGFLLGIAGAVFLARRITRPLHRNWSRGRSGSPRATFRQAIVDTSRDEVGDLARSFNDMTSQLVHTRERMEDANRRLVQPRSWPRSAAWRPRSPTRSATPDLGQAQHPKGGRGGELRRDDQSPPRVVARGDRPDRAVHQGASQFYPRPGAQPWSDGRSSRSSRNPSR